MKNKLYKIEKYNLLFRPISSIDLIENKYFIPFQLFSIIEEDAGIYGQIRKKFKQQQKITLDDKDKEKALPLIEYVLKTFVLNLDFNDFYNTYNFKGVLEVDTTIILNSLCFFKKYYLIQQTAIMNIDFLAQRYGKTPMEIICKDKNLYNDLDALCFNFFICSNALNIEKEKTVKINRGTKYV